MFGTIQRETMRQLCRPWEETLVGMRIDSTKTVHAMQRVFFPLAESNGRFLKKILQSRDGALDQMENIYAMLENQSY